MAAFVGKSGAVTIGSVTAILKEWTIDQSTENVDITSFSSSGYGESVPGIERWTMSASGFVNGTTHPVKPTAAATCTFSDGNNTWVGSVIITSMNIGNSLGDAVTVSFSGTGTGTFSSVT